jgi:integrase
MATIGRDPGGRKRILFVAPDGKRKTIRLGKVSEKAAMAVKLKVEPLVTAAMLKRPPDDETTRWVASLDAVMADKLAAVGLIPKRASTILGDFIKSYIQSRTDAKPLTHKKYKTTQQYLVDYFGYNKPLAEINENDADQWRLHLLQGRTENTVRKHIAVAKVFFRGAVKRRLIQCNPFAEIKATIQRNEKRDYFISRQETQKVLDACPDAEWRLIFALSRYAGLRCPSEHLGLRWGDIDWERDRMVIHSPKTEHHAGGESRVIPLFPELRPYLDEVFFEQAKPGSEYVITRYRESNVNLRTQLTKIIYRAGLTPWPKLFQNLRASRATELVQSFPSYVAAAWLGHCEAVAEKHYWQVTEEHFETAIKAAQNPAHPDASSGCQSLPVENGAFPNIMTVNDLHPTSMTDNVVNKYIVAEAGLEPARPITGTGF